jgi:uncharacterized membrane protein HdeD (DUF308 family)
MSILGMNAERSWIAALQGIVLIVLGIALLVWPGITVRLLVTLFGIAAIVWGVLGFVHMVGAVRRDVPWWPYLLEGVLGVGIGLAVLTWPGITVLIVSFAIAWWILFTGIVQFIYAFAGGGWLSAIVGILGVGIGIWFLANPLGAALTMIWLIAVYVLVFGVFLLISAYTIAKSAGRPAT